VERLFDYRVVARQFVDLVSRRQAARPESLLLGREELAPSSRRAA
jgi:hypothetical protein